jgi:hypothetical protein
VDHTDGVRALDFFPRSAAVRAFVVCEQRIAAELNSNTYLWDGTTVRLEVFAGDQRLLGATEALVEIVAAKVSLSDFLKVARSPILFWVCQN